MAVEFEEATNQTCLVHLLRRCEEMVEQATGSAVRFPRAVDRTDVEATNWPAEQEIRPPVINRKTSWGIEPRRALRRKRS